MCILKLQLQFAVRCECQWAVSFYKVILINFNFKPQIIYIMNEVSPFILIQKRPREIKIIMIKIKVEIRLLDSDIVILTTTGCS